jgi:hypothetical protein
MEETSALPELGVAHDAESESSRDKRQKGTFSFITYSKNHEHFQVQLLMLVQSF